MTADYHELVESNMGLVADVIKRYVENPDHINGFTYQDLHQIGCVGLCIAAQSYVPGRAKFSTYVYVVIRNEILMALEHATLGDRRVAFVDMSEDYGFLAVSDAEESTELPEAVIAAEQTSSGIIAKGIRALRLMAEGYSCREIGELMDAPANHITAWMSRARRHLRKNPAVAAFAH